MKVPKQWYKLRTGTKIQSGDKSWIEGEWVEATNAHTGLGVLPNETWIRKYVRPRRVGVQRKM